MRFKSYEWDASFQEPDSASIYSMPINSFVRSFTGGRITVTKYPFITPSFQSYMIKRLHACVIQKPYFFVHRDLLYAQTDGLMAVGVECDTNIQTKSQEGKK